MASGSNDERIVTSGFVVTPETVASRTFTTSFRGFDHTEVRTFLKRVSEELAAAAEREAHLRHQLHEAQNRAAHPEVDEEILTNALGEHAARLLGSAREQAASMKSEAEAKAARLMREVEAQISRIRSEADSLLARRVEEVDGVSANLRNAAEADATALREQAKADVEAELQAARSQGREMVAEARSVRERILADLARRRHVAEVQLDQLRAARERLLDAYSLVRRTLDEATQELKMAEVEARLAADQAARRAPEPPPAPPVADDAGHAAGSTGAAAAGAARTAATAVRPSRTEPGGAGAGGGRQEPRMRPPGRPGETRPPMPAPSRRPFAGEPATTGARAHGGEAVPPPGPSRISSPIVRRAPIPGGEPPSGPTPYGPTPPGPTPPGHSPSGHSRSGAAPSAGPPPSGPLEPPSILPRPVAPPPARPSMAKPPAPPAAEDQTADAPWPTADVDRVDALFARIKADRAATVAAATVAPQPPAAAPAEVEAAEAGTAVPAAEAPEQVEPAEAPAGPVTELPAAPQPSETGRASVADESARNRRDELLEPLEETLARQLKRVLQDEQNEVLDRMRRKRRRHHAQPLPDLEEQVGRFREAAESVLQDAVRAGIRFADPNASEAHAEESAGREVATALARLLAEPLRDRLARALEEGAENAEVSEVVSGVYRQWRSQEVEPLARHHAVIAFSRGAYAGYPEGAGLRWVVDDEAPCPDCDDNDLAGTVIKSQAFPTGQPHPPAHPGCRCILVPAI